MTGHHSRRLWLLLVAGLFAGLFLAGPARAQLFQYTLHLNDPSLDNEYLWVPIKTGLEGNNAYTIEAWVHPTVFGDFQTIVGNDYHTSFWLGLTPTGNVRFYPRGQSLGGLVDSPSAVPLDQWTHVAVTYHSAIGFVIYLNGVVDASGSGILGAVGTSAGEVRIGADYEFGGPDYFFRGYLDEIRIWNVARSLPEIRANIFIGLGRPSAFASGFYDALVANWSCEGAFLSGIPDFTSPQNGALFVNGDFYTHTTGFDAFGPPVAPNVALSLNGFDDYAIMPVSEDFGRGLTVMGWVAPFSFTGFPTVAGRDYSSSFWLGFSTTGQLRFYPTGGVLNYVESPSSIPTNRWTHVAATYANGRTVLHVNGRVEEISTAIAGPVGANGEDVWIGADREFGFPAYFFPGLLDDVKVFQGALSSDAVRRHMFLGSPSIPNPGTESDVDGVLVSLYKAGFDRGDDNAPAVGSNVHLVRGGTAAFSTLMGAIQFHPVAEFETAVLGGVSPLPDDDGSTFIGTDLYWPLSSLVADVDVYLSAPITDLASTQIRLKSPTGTLIDLLSPGDAVGRDLLAVIDDSETETWSTGANPFHDGVQPSDPLSTFNGENPLGYWRLELSSSAGNVGLWAWGIRVNDQTVGVDEGPLQAVGLRLVGAQPVRASGILAFDLPVAAQLQLGLFDLQGRRVLSLLNGRQSPGSFRMSFNAAALQPGVYFARLLVDGQHRGEVRVTVVH